LRSRVVRSKKFVFRGKWGGGDRARGKIRKFIRFVGGRVKKERVKKYPAPGKKQRGSITQNGGKTK